MGKASVTFRIHFVVQDDGLIPGEITRLLGIRPTWSGTEAPEGRKPFGYWVRYHSLRCVKNLDKAVQGLCGELEPMKGKIRRLAKSRPCWFEIGCFFQSEKIIVPCIPLNANSMEALASFGVPVYSFPYPCSSNSESER